MPVAATAGPSEASAGVTSRKTPRRSSDEAALLSRRLQRRSRGRQKRPVDLAHDVPPGESGRDSEQRAGKPDLADHDLAVHDERALTPAGNGERDRQTAAEGRLDTVDDSKREPILEEVQPQDRTGARRAERRSRKRGEVDADDALAGCVRVRFLGPERRPLDRRQARRERRNLAGLGTTRAGRRPGPPEAEAARRRNDWTSRTSERPAARRLRRR